MPHFIVDGHMNREVSMKPGLTERTASNCLFGVFQRLGIPSRVELVLYLLKRQ